MTVIGIDIGGSHVGAGLFTESNGSLQLLRNIESRTVFKTPEELLQSIGRLTEELVKDDRAMVTHIGIGCPGSIKEGILISAANFPGWSMVPLATMVGTLWKTAEVILVNDADAALAAEICSMKSYATSENPAPHNVAMITIGTGIGLGLYIMDRFYSGAHGLVEGGHSIISHDTESTCACGQRGCVEIYASARQMTRRYHSLQLEQQAEGADCASADPHVSCEEIFNQVERGHATADRVLEETAEALGVFCLNLCRTVDPQVIVLGGGMAEAGDALLSRVKKQMERRNWKIGPILTEVRLASCKQWAGVIGSAYMAYRALSTNQSAGIDDPNCQRVPASPPPGAREGQRVPGEAHVVPRSQLLLLTFSPYLGLFLTTAFLVLVATRPKGNAEKWRRNTAAGVVLFQGFLYVAQLVIGKRVVYPDSINKR